jgi:hypothetical protein
VVHFTNSLRRKEFRLRVNDRSRHKGCFSFWRACSEAGFKPAQKKLAKFENAPYETVGPYSDVSQPNPLLFCNGFTPTLLECCVFQGVKAKTMKLKALLEIDVAL